MKSCEIKWNDFKTHRSRMKTIDRKWLNKTKQPKTNQHEIICTKTMSTEMQRHRLKPCEINSHRKWRNMTLNWLRRDDMNSSDTHELNSNEIHWTQMKSTNIVWNHVKQLKPHMTSKNIYRNNITSNNITWNHTTSIEIKGTRLTLPETAWNLLKSCENNWNQKWSQMKSTGIKRY